MRLKEDTRIALTRLENAGYLRDIILFIEDDLIMKFKDAQTKEDIFKIKNNIDFLSEIEILLTNEVNDG
jgi:hypothetical protein